MAILSSSRVARMPALITLMVLCLTSPAAAKNHPSYINYTNFLDNFGVGLNFSCQPVINQVLETADGYNQLGANAATNLITLIPTLLTVGNLYVPRSSEVFGTSFFVGIFSAAFGLGLPVHSISGIPRKQVIDLQRLPLPDYEQLRSYGKVVKDAIDGNPNWAARALGLSELEGWYLGLYGTVVQGFIVNRPQQFRRLKARVHRFVGRNHWWYIPSFCICILQLFFFFFILSSTASITLAQPLWSCKSDITEAASPELGTTLWWLLASAAFAIVVRTVEWMFSSHQIVRLYHLPGLSRFQHLCDDPNAITTAKQLPPSHHPIRPVESVVQTCLLAWARLIYVLKNPILAVQAAQSRRRPLIVMVHLSLQSRGPFLLVWTGFIQGLTLLILTCFFGTYWGGTVIEALVLLVILLLLVTFGRLLGLLYVRWSAHAYGFTMIECNDHTEIRGVTRLLASMPDVMVEVSGAQYIWGTRVDGNKEFRRWLVEVEKGNFDEPADTLSRSKRRDHMDEKMEDNKDAEPSLGSLQRDSLHKSIISDTRSLEKVDTPKRPQPPPRQMTDPTIGRPVNEQDGPARTWPLSNTHDSDDEDDSDMRIRRT